MKTKYKAVYTMFTPRSRYEPTNGTQPTWQVLSRKGKVQALCLDEKHALRLAKILNKRGK